MKLEPQVTVPAEFAATAWTRDDALLRIVRGRLASLGPAAAEELAAPLAVPVPHIDAALTRLEVEGAVMRGRFTPDASRLEWCDRRLLARIHRYTVKRLRQEIEPVEPRDFMRFLFEWQRVAPGTGVEGPDALAAVLAQLEGFEAPAAAWESEILPARLKAYDFTWLDDLCLPGAWSGPASARPRPTASANMRAGRCARRRSRAAAAQHRAVDGAGQERPRGCVAAVVSGPGAVRVSDAAWRIVLR